MLRRTEHRLTWATLRSSQARRSAEAAAGAPDSSQLRPPSCNHDLGAWQRQGAMGVAFWPRVSSSAPDGRHNVLVISNSPAGRGCGQ